MGHTFSISSYSTHTLHNFHSCCLGKVNLHKKKNPIKLFIQNLVPKETPELSAIIAKLLRLIT